jgi:hypothetical protein
MVESKRLCPKCGVKVPLRVKIEGVVRNLKSRKFCFACSPFGCHNTKSDDPSRPAKSKRYSEYTVEQKKKNIKGVCRRGLLRKQTLIEMSGNKCSRCEYVYNGCERAFSFHHLDRKEKKFSLSMNELWGRKWEIILEEYNKCVMLCVRCHAEVEDEISKKNGTLAQSG